MSIFNIVKVENININIIQATHDTPFSEVNQMEEGCHPNKVPNLFCEEKIKKIPTTSLTAYEYQHHFQHYKDSIAISTTSTSDVLKRHKISTHIRAKMVDWMIEVTNIFHCRLATLFASVNIMDRYFMEELAILEDDNIHIIGTACMVIASKLIDETPILLQDASACICRGKITVIELKKMEHKICQTLKWDIWHPTILEIIRAVMCELSMKDAKDLESNETKMLMGSIIKLSEKYAIMSLYELRILHGFSVEQLANACIYHGMEDMLNVMVLYHAPIMQWMKFVQKDAIRISKILLSIKSKLELQGLMNHEKYLFEC